MKVLHMLNELRPSGAETMLCSGAATWKSQGVDLHVLSTGPTLGPYAVEFEKAGYQVHHLPASRGPTFIGRLIRFVRAGRYDLVHQHAEAMRYWKCLAALLGGAKVATTVHNTFQFGGQLRWRRAWQRRHLQRLGVKFVAIAPGVQHNERARFGVQAELAWNWFDADRFTPIKPQERAEARQRLGLGPFEPVIVSVGNCSEIKNHASLLKALQQLPGIRYLHVGEEDAENSERILAMELGLQSQVQFVGWSDNPRNILAAADVFVMPSLHEGFSIAALEAIGSALPCVLADSPGLRDLAHLNLRLNFCATTPGDIAESIFNCFAQIDEQKTLALGHSAIITRLFRPEAGAMRYYEVHRTLLC